jgi:two-component system sensor histidine kinase/response regulator
MDVQMPVMDGYEATRQLRQDERFATLPVIAMTAHALSEERELCAAAGMTGHLCKPVEPAALYAALALHYRESGPSETPHQLPLPASSPNPLPSPIGTAMTLAPVPGLDMAAGLRRAGGHAQLYRQLLADFATEYASAPSTLASLLASGDRTGAEHLAHSLHGLSATLGADQVASLAAQFERDCRVVGDDATSLSLARLAMPLHQLTAALTATLPQPAMEANATWQAGEFNEPAGVADGMAAGRSTTPSGDWLPRLRAMLAACDSEALALWAACQTEAAGLLGRASARRLDSALSQFDFDQALVVLSAVAPQQE